MMAATAKSRIGCLNCRERNIRCDLNRPLCTKCSISGRKCQGYRKQSIDHGRLSPTKPILGKDSDLTIENSPRSGPVLIDQFLSLFLQDYLPKSQTQIVHNHQHGLSWAQYMPDISNKSTALVQSLAAVSLAIVGRSNEDERLIKRSFEIYGSALRSLQKSLANPDSRSSQDTLASMMALKTYELWQPTFKSGHGWMAHVQGAGKIIQGGGPISSEVPLNVSLLSDFRTSSVFDACGRRRAIDIGQSEWKKFREGKPKLSELMLDIIVEIPAMFEKTDDLLENPAKEPGYTLQRVALMQSYALVHQGLEAWYQQAEKSISGPLYWQGVSAEQVGDSNAQFGPSLQFPSLPVAQMVLIYWSIRAMLYGEMDHLFSPPSSPHSTPSSITEDPDTPPNEYFSSAISFADLVVRSVPFCTNPAHGMAGVQTVAFPCWTTQHNIYFGRSVAKHEYMYNLSRHIGGSRGLFFLSLITNLTRAEYAAMGKYGLTSRIESQKGSEITFMDKKSTEDFKFNILPDMPVAGV